MRASKHMGVSKHVGSPKIRGHLNKLGHPNIQEGCPNMGVSKHTRVSKHMVVSKHTEDHPNKWRVSKHTGVSTHMWVSKYIGASKQMRGMYAPYVCQTKGCPYAPNTGSPLYIWIPPIFLDGGIQTCGVSKHMGASKHTGGMSKHGGVQTYRMHPNTWGHPNI